MQATSPTKIGEFRLFKKDGTDLSANALLNDVRRIPTEQSIEFQTGEGEIHCHLFGWNSHWRQIWIRSAPISEITQYKITNNGIGTTEVWTK